MPAGRKSKLQARGANSSTLLDLNLSLSFRLLVSPSPGFRPSVCTVHALAGDDPVCPGMYDTYFVRCVRRIVP